MNLLCAEHNPPTSLRHPSGMEIYAELAGDGKKQGIKSPCDNKLKTMENGVIGTYVAAFCGYRHGKLFTAATKKRQARLAWEEMSRFIQIDPDLQELFSVKDYKSTIEAHETSCNIEALSKESGLDDGFRAIFVSLDEIHSLSSGMWQRCPMKTPLIAGNP